MIFNKEIYFIQDVGVINNTFKPKDDSKCDELVK
jgi:hypothetical protein